MTAPPFSLIALADNLGSARLGRLVDSIIAQAAEASRGSADWELVVLRGQYVSSPSWADHPQVRVLPSAATGAAAWNEAIAAARGEYLIPVIPRGGLAPDALTALAAAVVAHPAAEVLYGWEVVGAGEVNGEVDRRPAWSPERLRCQPYLGGLVAYRRSLLEALGGPTDDHPGAQWYDLQLRAAERGAAFQDVPRVLFQRPAGHGDDGGEDRWEWEAGCAAVQAHLDRLGIPAVADLAPTPGIYRIERTAAIADPVSVIIPTRGSSGVVRGEERVFVERAVSSLLNAADDVPLEVVVVYDTATPAVVLENLRAACQDRAALRLIEFGEDFNFSRKCNLGAIAATGRWLLFLNDDVEIITPDFVRHLVAPLLEAGVGATGARLLFEDDTIQHGGVIYRQGDAGHACFGLPDHDPGPGGALLVNRECSGLTAACLAVSRQVFYEAGGFCELLPLNYNDVDLSLKIRATGRRLLWLTEAAAYHYESATREARVERFELDVLRDRWYSPKWDPYLPE
ncbi:MAG: glycosyltransferase [Promicromonosporaceae bacterium]|nr:glycosyltransferase [Promicromonosporaceae bacterium]